MLFGPLCIDTCDCVGVVVVVVVEVSFYLLLCG